MLKQLNERVFTSTVPWLFLSEISFAYLTHIKTRKGEMPEFIRGKGIIIYYSVKEEEEDNDQE